MELQAICFGETKDQVHVLDCLAGGSLDQIVDCRDDDGAAVGLLGKSDIAIVGVANGMKIGHLAGGVNADEGFVRIGILIDLVDAVWVEIQGCSAEVNGFEDAAINGDQLSGEAELGFFEIGILKDFGDVAVVEERVGREVFGDLAEGGLLAGLTASAGDATLGIANYTGVEMDGTGVDERPDRQIGGGGVAAGVGNEAGVLDGVAIELGQTVGGFLKKGRGGVRFFVPAGVVFGSAEAESAGQIDDLGSGGKEICGEFHGSFWRSGEEDNGEIVVFDRLAAEGSGSWAFGTVFERNTRDKTVAVKDLDQFVAGITPETDDARAERLGAGHD